MKGIVTLAVLASIGVLAFQNCNKRPGAAAEDSSRQDALVSRLDMPMNELSKISFYIADVQTVNQAGHTYSLKYNKTLSIDMETGLLTESNDFDKSTKKFCLPDDVKAELVSILDASQVCKWGTVTDADTMCGMAMQLPYAELSMGDEVMGLGSATDTCGNNAVNLCDSREEVLKAFMEKLNASYSGYTCN